MVDFQFQDTKPTIDTATLIEDLRAVAIRLSGESVTQDDYRRHGKFSSTVVKKRFGSWNKALIAAGLHLNSRPNVSDVELFDNLRTAWITLGRQPRRGEMQPPASKLTHHPYVRRYGSWLAAMRAFVEAQDAPGNPESAEGQPSLHGNRFPSLGLRFKVMRRDRFTCVNCGRSPATDVGTVLHIDHVMPFSRGGRTEFSNLRTLCKACNLGKGDLTD
jgi:hypothetical protein